MSDRLAGCLVLPARTGCKIKSTVVACRNHLKQVALGQIVWENDYDSRGLAEHLPTDVASVRRSLTPDGINSYYQALSNELTSPVILICPSDRRSPAPDFRSLTTNNISYFLNIDAMFDISASTALNGDRHITFTPAPHEQIVTLTTNLSLDWARNVGHSSPSTRIGIIALVDGSVQRASRRDLDELMAPSRASNHRLLFP